MTRQVNIAVVRKICRLADSGLTDRNIADELRRSFGYVARLRRIGQGLRPDLFAQWSVMAMPLSAHTVDQISRLPHNDQEEAFARATRATIRTRELTTLRDALLAARRALAVIHGGSLPKSW